MQNQVTTGCVLHVKDILETFSKIPNKLTMKIALM